MSYSMIVGGITLAKDGVVMASCGSAGVYSDMEYKDIQMLWEYADKNTAIRSALDTFAKTVQAELIRLGHLSGIKQNKMTMEDLENGKKIITELTK